MIGNLRASWVRKIEVTHVLDCPVPGDCWIWHGARDKVSGYGRVQVEGSCRYIHRIVYQQLVGPIPDGLQLDHLCRQRACCAPHHLEPVTCLVNVRRGNGGASRTHCPQGHEYTPENTYLHQNAKGYTRRTCRKCREEYMPAYRAARKAAREHTWDKYNELQAEQIAS
jgi:hypothetical protein